MCQATRPSSSEIRAFAAQSVGWPWKADGREIFQGTDCLGLLIAFSERFGFPLPELSPENLGQWCEFGVEISAEEKMCGDVVVLLTAEGHAFHVGVVLEGDRVLHAIEKCGVIVSRLRALSSRAKQVLYYRPKIWQEGVADGND